MDNNYSQDQSANMKYAANDPKTQYPRSEEYSAPTTSTITSCSSEPVDESIVLETTEVENNSSMPTATTSTTTSSKDLPKVKQTVSKTKSRDELVVVDDKKIFVGGLPWNVDFGSVNDYFAQFGKIVFCRLMIDPHTKRPRGFAFVRFLDKSGFEECLKHKDHRILGTLVDVKLAIPRIDGCNNNSTSSSTTTTSRNLRRGPSSSSSRTHVHVNSKPYEHGGHRSRPRAHNNHRTSTMSGSSSREEKNISLKFPSPTSNVSIASTSSTTSTTNDLACQENNMDTWYKPAANKLFVGGLSPAVTNSALYEYFNRFEGVIDTIVMFDRETRRSRGFGFITLCTMAQAEVVKAHHPHVILGKIVDVKPAERRAPRPPTPAFHYQHHNQNTSSSSSTGGRRVAYRDNHQNQTNVPPFRNFSDVDNPGNPGGSVPGMMHHPSMNVGPMCQPSYGYYTAAYYGGNVAYAYPYHGGTIMPGYHHIPPISSYHQPAPPPPPGDYHMNYNDSSTGYTSYYPSDNTAVYPYPNLTPSYDMNYNEDENTISVNEIEDELNTTNLSTTTTTTTNTAVTCSSSRSSDVTEVDEALEVEIAENI